MNIPEYFKEKIINIYGEKGEVWIKDLPRIINLCIEKWSLTELKEADDLSYNFIMLGKSAHYGDVAIKIGVPHPEFNTELKALELYGGKNIIKCYDADLNLNAMVLERVRPGDNLTSLEGLDNQLNIAADLIHKLPIVVKDGHGFPSYSDWIKRAFKRARDENKVGDKMLYFMDEVEKLYGELEAYNYNKVLLHGDLHHWNILKDRDSGWKVIDPKGVIGIAPMESARFIDNHIDMVGESKKFNHLDNMVTVFSHKFKERKGNIAICYFILRVLSTCWTFEDANPSPEDLKKGIDECEFALNYINSL